MRPRLLAGALLLLAGGCSTPPTSTLPSAGAFPPKLYALGTEPFWSLAIDGRQLTYATADKPEKATAQVARRESAGELTLDGTLAGSPILARVTRGTCSDGMSDRIYPFAATVRLGSQTLQGCASDRNPAEARN